MSSYSAYHKLPTTQLGSCNCRPKRRFNRSNFFLHNGTLLWSWATRGSQSL